MNVMGKRDYRIQKNVGLNPGAGKNFSLRISINVHLYCLVFKICTFYVGDLNVLDLSQVAELSQIEMQGFFNKRGCFH